MYKLRNQKTKEYVDNLKSNPDLKDFVRRLKYWRKQRNITQLDLSIDCGFYQNKIPDIETLYTACSVPDLLMIAKVLKISPAVLFIDDETIINQLNTEFNYQNPTEKS